MAKKKGGGGKKGKGKAGKQAKKKDELSRLEKEIFLLKIRELENKIARKQRLCRRLEDGVNLHKVAYEEVHQTGGGSIDLLEEALKQQVATNCGYAAAIGNVSAANDEQDLENMAAGFRKLDELRSCYDAELEVLRKEVKVLESFHPGKLERRIEELEQQLNFEGNQSSVLNSVELDRRREKYLREVMPHILEDQAMIFQDGLKNRVPLKFQRVAEETRWWKTGLKELQRTSAIMDAKNETLEGHVRAVQEQARTCKEHTLRASAGLQALRREVADKVHRHGALKKRRAQAQRLQAKTASLDRESGALVRRLDECRRLQKCQVERLRQNEALIKEQELRLGEEMDFGEFLESLMLQAQGMIEAEVMHPLILSFTDPSAPANLLLELQLLFDRAAKSIYDMRQRPTPLKYDSGNYEYDQLGSYKMGSLGLIPVPDSPTSDGGESWTSCESGPEEDEVHAGKDRSKEMPAGKRASKETLFDFTAAKIMSELGFIHRLKRKSRNLYAFRRYRLRR